MNEVEIVVTSDDKTEKGYASVRKATRKLQADVGKDTDKIKNHLEKVGKSALSMVRPVSSFVATVAGVASLAGPAVTALVAIGKGMAAIGKGVAAAGPAAATLPALAAGFLLVKSVIAAAGPAMGEALSPITDKLDGLKTRIGQIASRGLPDLANQFNRVNFPTINRDTGLIAESINRIAVNTGQWVNSAHGAEAISGITSATAKAMKSLEAPTEKVAISFGELVRRVGGGPITSLADQVGKLADKTAAWLDSISKGDVDDAMEKLGGWGTKVKDVVTMLGDMGKWMAENEGKVKAFSDVVAGAALAIGIATGNVPAILAGSFSLIANHWDDIKEKFQEVKPFFHDIWEGVKNDPGLRGIWDSVSDAWDNFVSGFKKGIADIGPEFKETINDLKEAWEEWAPIIKAWWEGVGKPVFGALGRIIGEVVVFWIQGIGVWADILRVLAGVFRYLWSVAEWSLNAILNAAVYAFGWVPGLGDKLRKAQGDFNAFRDRVNSALDGIRDKTVNVTIAQRYTVTGLPVAAAGQARAAFAHGGVRGAASGGPQNGWTMVGEMGRELVKLAPGSQVIPNGQTERMMSGSHGGGRQVGGGGGKQVVEVRFTSDGQALIDKIIEGIVYTIRTDRATAAAFGVS